MTDDDVDTEPDEDEDVPAPPPPLIHRPQGNWLEERLEEYAERLDELNSPG
jgi:hypothetical protein